MLEREISRVNGKERSLRAETNEDYRAIGLPQCIRVLQRNYQFERTNLCVCVLTCAHKEIYYKELAHDYGEQGEFMVKF